jgi:spectinomycin phosphotransferase
VTLDAGGLPIGPPIEESVLRRALADAHGIAIADLSPDHEGADVAAWAYRATTTDGSRWFVKLRREVRPAAILVPRHLRAIGLTEVVASVPPVGGGAGAQWLEIGPWSVLVSPLLDAPSALRAGLSLEGWARLGAFAARLHAVELPAGLSALVPDEDFRPKATRLARRLDDRIAGRGIETGDELARLVVSRWMAERRTIVRLVDRADALGRRIREGPPPPRTVLCHADFHAGNVLVDAGGTMSVVDWDELLHAPPERDLMFVRGSAIAEIVTDAQADAFERGYGSAGTDPLLIAYYRIDWAVQDLAGFADQVLFGSRTDPGARARAAALFDGQFAAGSEVDTAIAADDALGGR